MGFLETIAESHRFASLGCFVFLVLLVYQLLKMIIAKSTRLKYSIKILKYKIRDAVIDYMKPYFSNINTKKDALEILNSQKNNITNLAKKIATDNGYTYPVTVFIGNFYFPTKEYSEIILPEGYYDALKIELGDAKGQNWWCVMFPSLCIIDSTNLNFSESSEQLLQENLSEEELSIISNSNATPDIKIKFKLIELFENL